MNRIDKERLWVFSLSLDNNDEVNINRKIFYNAMEYLKRL